MTGDETVKKWLNQVPTVDSSTPWRHSTNANETYSPCAPLSWVHIMTANLQQDQPQHTMLFHNGEYIGTTTAQAYPWSDRILRKANNRIEVVYRWPQPGDDPLHPTGQSVAEFYWDDTLGKVRLEGEVPSV